MADLSALQSLLHAPALLPALLLLLGLSGLLHALQVRHARSLRGLLGQLQENNQQQQTALALQQQAEQHAREQLQQQAAELARVQAQLRLQDNRLRAAELQAGEARTRCSELEQREAQSREQRQQAEQRLQQLSQEYHALGSRHAALEASLQQREQGFAEQQQLLRDSREQLRLEFEQLAGQIFEARGQAFSQHSQQSLDALLKPFREQIEQFRARVEDIHHRDTRQQAELNHELQQLKQLNQQITREAHELSTALRGQKKTQGNWGELVLENVLERSGLRAGLDYQRELSRVTADGQRQRPDAVVFLPQDKHLIIDAKVSLNAWTRYLNAEQEAERQQALVEHGRAVGERIRELSQRSYFELPGLNSPEMVFMFIPVEAAFVEALKADESLFQRAIEQNVLVATPTTLLTSLNIVRQLWRFEDQNRHTAELAEKAARVHDKLRTFLASMDQVGRGLERAQEAWRGACDQLVSGRGNLVKQVAEFRELGVSVKGELGEQWVERAALELERPGAVDDPE